MNRETDKMLFLYKDDIINGKSKISIESMQASMKYQVAEIYKACRKEKNMTQNDLAKITGIAQPNINRFESASSNPSLELLVKMAAAMGMEVEISLKKADKLR